MFFIFIFWRLYLAILGPSSSVACKFMQPAECRLGMRARDEPLCLDPVVDMRQESELTVLVHIACKGQGLRKKPCPGHAHIDLNRWGAENRRII